MPKHVPACRAHDIEVAPLTAQGAGGWWTGGVLLTSRARACLVWGFVDVRFLDASGAEVARSVHERGTVRQDWALLGEARVFWWIANWCARSVRVATVEATLPVDPSPIALRLDPPMTIGARCDAPASPHILSVAPVAPSPTDPPHVTAPPVTTLGARIDSPSTVTAGARLRYTVTLRNLSESAVPLDPCPSYLEWLGGHQLPPPPPPPPNIGSKPWAPAPMYAGVSKASYQLNCAVPSIGPLSALSFEMFIVVPPDANGPDILTWAFVGGTPIARAPITILPR